VSAVSSKQKRAAADKRRRRFAGTHLGVDLERLLEVGLPVSSKLGQISVSCSAHIVGGGVVRGGGLKRGEASVGGGEGGERPESSKELLGLLDQQEVLLHRLLAFSFHPPFVRSFVRSFD
jgi:hypothetical protein